MTIHYDENGKPVCGHASVSAVPLLSKDESIVTCDPCKRETPAAARLLEERLEAARARAMAKTPIGPEMEPLLVAMIVRDELYKHAELRGDHFDIGLANEEWTGAVDWDGGGFDLLSAVKKALAALRKMESQ